MTLSDRLAADALLRLLEEIRRTGGQGRIEVIVDGGEAREVRPVKIGKGELVKAE